MQLTNLMMTMLMQARSTQILWGLRVTSILLMKCLAQTPLTKATEQRFQGAFTMASTRSTRFQQVRKKEDFLQARNRKKGVAGRRCDVVTTHRGSAQGRERRREQLFKEWKKTANMKLWHCCVVHKSVLEKKGIWVHPFENNSGKRIEESSAGKFQLEPKCLGFSTGLEKGIKLQNIGSKKTWKSTRFWYCPFGGQYDLKITLLFSTKVPPLRISSSNIRHGVNWAGATNWFILHLGRGVRHFYEPLLDVL